jgi:DNA-binding beta-propeller fold protein YncE
LRSNPHHSRKYDQAGNLLLTISTGTSAPFGVAVDANGKIYVAGINTGTVTTFNADGSAGTPTITGLNGPTGVAVDAAG